MDYLQLLLVAQVFMLDPGLWQVEKAIEPRHDLHAMDGGDLV